MGITSAAIASRSRAGFRLWLCVVCLLIGRPAWAVDLDRQVTIDIAPQPLQSAVIEFARQTGIQIVTDGANVASASSPGVSGVHALGQALRLLLQGTGLEFKPIGEATVALIGGRSTSGEPELLPTIPVPIADPEEKFPRETQRAVQLDSITVTANKRAQDIRNVAGSVSALSGDRLEKMGAQSLKDYLKLVPGVAMNEQGPDRSAPVIRGIASETMLGFGSRTTGIFVDEIPLSDLFVPSASIDMNPFDLERVEVMKGPQGTLFGSSSIAGAIRYITHKPELHVWQAKLFGSYTDIEHGEQAPLGAAMVNIPLGHTAAVRAVGLYRESPGFIDDLNRGIPDVGELEQSAARVLASWEPTDRGKVTATWLKQKSATDDLDFADQRERLERSNTNGPNIRKSDFSVANLVATYDFDWGTALSNSSYVTKDNFSILTSDRGLDSQNLPFSIQRNENQGHLDGFSQELRLASPEGSDGWQWLGGLAYLRYDSLYSGRTPLPLVDALLEQLSLDPFGLLPIFPINTPLGAISGRDNTALIAASLDATATEEAVFGEVSRWFGDRWELTLGGRLFQTRLVADTLIRGVETVLFAPGQIEARDQSEVKDHGFNPKVSLRFLLNRHVNLYALAAKGFQFGGVQLSPLNPALEALTERQPGPGYEPFKSSTLWNYEVGARTEWWDRRLHIDASVFSMHWKDLQLTQVVSFAGLGVFGLLTNVGKATSDGVELAIRVTPLRGLSLQSTACWLDAVTATPLQTAEGNFPSGTQLPGSAGFQWASTLAYDQRLSLLGDWTASLALTHTRTGPMYNDLSHSAQYGDYDTLDAQLRLVSNDRRWLPELTVAMTNLRDERGVSGVFTCSSCRYEDVYFIRPRTVTLSLAVRF